MPSSGSLEPSRIDGPDLEEYEIKRAIVAVCRLWWDVGIELLYGKVSIRWVDSLAALVCTLVAPTFHVAKLVKKIMISCMIPFGNDITAFEKCMKHVIVNCPSLSSLVVNPSFQPVPRDIPSWELVLRSIRVSDGIVNIRHLDWGYYLRLDGLVSLLQHCPNIESLQFHLHDHYHRVFEKASSMLVLLPHLQELRIVRHDIPGTPIDHAESKLVANWSMPQLQRLIYSNSDSFGLANIVEFCRFQCSSLRYLHLGPDWRHWILADTLQNTLDECPALEHLVLWMSGNLGIIHALSHPKIMWIDVWVDIPCVLDGLNVFVRTKCPRLLSLRRMRVFDNRLWRPYATDLPTLLPPMTAIQRDGFEFTYIGLNIQEKGHIVFQTDTTYNFIVENNGSDSDDEGSDFDEDTILSYDDTSDRNPGSDYDDDDDSSSNQEDEAGGDTGAPADQTTDYDMALACFLSILES
jgi:hypothetical protein